MSVGCVLLLLLAAAWGPAGAEEGVQIRQSEFNQLVTSSTLHWVGGGGGSFPKHAVEGAKEIQKDPNSEDVNEPEDPEDESDTTPTPPPPPRSVYVCRARKNGVWVPGSLLPETGYCHISLLDTVSRYEHYQILQNLDGSARLNWVEWNKFTVVLPMGAVAGGETYVARRKVEPVKVGGFSHYLGKLDPNDGLGRITIVNEDGEEKGYTDGEVLVEMEPLRYELSRVKFNMNHRKRVIRHLKVLATGVLRNGAGTIPVEVDQAMQYSYTYSLNWGQARATLTGLPTIVRDKNGTVLDDIKWGLEDKDERRSVFTVKYPLEPGTAVNVTLLGNSTETELFYSGKLVSFFADNKTTERAINGSRREVDMLDLHADYSPVYFLRNNSLVPTTTTTTTTTTSTTTTTTTTSQPPVPVPEPPVPARKPSKTDKSDMENEINRGMLGDQALSQQKENASKQERGVTTPDGKGSAGTLHTSTATFLAAIVVSIAVVQRIT